MRTVLVVAPHPDDESLGCGGTLLRARAEGADIHWLVVTAATVEGGFSPDRVAVRRQEIERVAASYGFASVHELGYPTTTLDTVSLGELTSAIADVVRSVAPTEVLVPFRGDVHSDHTVVFDATISATKTFRAPSVKSVLMYETLSETEFGMRPEVGAFRPQVFVDIEDYVDRKLEILSIFASEMHPFPFPRSDEAVKALAALRGVQSGTRAAEAFMVLKEVR